MHRGVGTTLIESSTYVVAYVVRFLNRQVNKDDTCIECGECHKQCG